MRGLTAFLCTTVLIVPLALAPAAKSQIVVEVGVQPVCTYGYYDYAPYQCAPIGFYGPGYFYNGIVLGMGPWAGWGYGHGWGGHRFTDGGGGRYNGGGGAAANRAYANGGSRAATARPSAAHAYRSNSSHPAAGARPGASHAAPHATTARPSASHAAPRATAERASAPRGGGDSHPRP